jgi:hypothetical protein
LSMRMKLTTMSSLIGGMAIMVTGINSSTWATA